ncbi:hypothetical protein PIB30_029812 [Stylosanthes scabra]|uniref:F-box domain-containing protein n=1 Tax=Stylosanthes scabra TaxID=79078 RepID=A0ABU6UAK8_9FABA|nr:hypothetical protein [Stylosanthes scabra]
MNLPVLPDNIIQHIFVTSDTSTFVSCRCLSKYWNDTLLSNEVVSDHLALHYSKTILLHLKNPLLKMRMGRISLFDLHKGIEIQLRSPVQWDWFDVIACSHGFISARFSYDRVSSHIIIWNPITNTRRFIEDPGSGNASRYMFSKNLAVYTFFMCQMIRDLEYFLFKEIHIFNMSVVVGWQIFFMNKLVVYGNRPFSIMGFSMHSGSWSKLIIPDYALQGFFPRLITNGYKFFLVDVDPCGLVYGLHSHEILIGNDFEIHWGPSILCPFAYISQTPTIMIDDMIQDLEYFLFKEIHIFNMSVVVGWQIFFMNKLAVYGNRPFSIMGFSMHSGSWSELIIPDYALKGFLPRLITNGYKLFLVDVDPCGLVYGLHSHEILIGNDFEIHWGPSVLCPFEYISQTPTIMIDDMIHVVSDADISDLSFESALSEIRFSIIDIDIGESSIVRTMRSNAIIGVSRVFQYMPNINKLYECL